VRPTPLAASFRDPSGHVYDIDGRILRTITERAAPDYAFVRQSGLLDRLVSRGWCIAATEVEPAAFGLDMAPVVRAVEHPRLPFVSYPYEWPFALLKAAALHHLDVHLEALDAGVTLSDASAYNIQFIGPRPVFIDLLSFRRYREGEFWLGHRQFCEQFLNPLLLQALFGVPHNAWFRGALEGIPTPDLARLLRWHHKLSWRMLAHVALPARFQAWADARQSAGETPGGRSRRMPLSGYRGMLRQLRRWIAGLEPAGGARSIWEDYERTQGYDEEERARKTRFVADFVSATRPAMLWDLGCNAGAYAELALQSGAGHVVGFDSDQGALGRAYRRALEKDLRFLPLVLDGANPSPDQGWNAQERLGLHSRGPADAVLALAFAHHLAFGRNLPLAQVVAWIVRLAPRGVIEFVEKSDPAVRRMLRLREDVFDDYGERTFAEALSGVARIVRSETVSATGRRLYWYDRAGDSG
jgi:ribosomal protein L11 methylase PrmA